MAVELCRRFLNSTRESEANLKRVIATSLLIAQKLVSDLEVLDLFDYSIITGLPVEEIEILELEFCTALKFELHVSALDLEMTRLLVLGKLNH